MTTKPSTTATARRTAKNNIFNLSPEQTDATLLANNSQHCWMLPVASVCTPCCMLLDVVACCCAKFETSQTFAQLFQRCWGHARSLRMVYKDLWVVSFPRCTAGPNIAGSCCIRLHTTANKHATTPTIVGATMLGVVASVCTPLPTSTQQLSTLLAQQCWELLRPFARSLTCCVRLHTLLRVVESCGAKFETGQTFTYVQTDATTPNNVESVCAGLYSNKILQKCCML